VNLNVLHFAVTKTNGMDLFVIKFEISFGGLLGTINCHPISTNFMHIYYVKGIEVTTRKSFEFYCIESLNFHQ
jgi:hypothetical protein